MATAPNIGGRDGHFLEQVMDRAARAGVSDRLRVRMSLSTDTRTGLTAENGIAIIPGQRGEEVIVLNAHVDGWFDGAGDNADGLAVLMALARHLAEPAHKPARTFVFVAARAITRRASTVRAVSRPRIPNWRRRP